VSQILRAAPAGRGEAAADLIRDHIGGFDREAGVHQDATDCFRQETLSLTMPDT